MFPVLLYGREPRTLKKHIAYRLEAFDIWAYRKMLRLSWVDRVINDKMLTKNEKVERSLKHHQIQQITIFGPSYEGRALWTVANDHAGSIKPRKETHFLDKQNKTVLQLNSSGVQRHQKIELLWWLPIFLEETTWQSRMN